MLNYRDMQIGMERVKDARRARDQRHQVKMLNLVEKGPLMTALTQMLTAVGGWFVKEPAALRQRQATHVTPAHEQK